MDDPESHIAEEGINPIHKQSFGNVVAENDSDVPEDRNERVRFQTNENEPSSNTATNKVQPFRIGEGFTYSTDAPRTPLTNVDIESAKIPGTGGAYANGVQIDVKTLSYSVLVNNKMKQLLKNVSFTLEKGSMCALMGPSGAGKR